MNLQQLRHLIALAESGGFRKAAERLHMTQPPLSASIKRLEEDLGVTLLSRGTGGTTLTEIGQAVASEARQVLFHLEQMRSISKSFNTGAIGRLRIGFVASASFEFLPKMLPLFTDKYPNVQLELQESTTERILQHLDDEKLDVGLVRYPIAHTCLATIEQVEFDTLAVAVARSHPLASNSVVPLKELKDEPFIMYSRRHVPSLHAMVIHTCQQENFVPRISQEAIQIQTILSLVESGLGVALVPMASSKWASEKVAIRNLSEATIPINTGIALAYRADRESAPAKRFREMVSGEVLPKAPIELRDDGAELSSANKTPSLSCF